MARIRRYDYARTEPQQIVFTLYAQLTSEWDEPAIQRGLTVYELAVKLWEGDPGRFCIQGFPQYPDLNKLMVMLSKPTGPVKAGHVSRANNRLTLTMEGLALGRQLSEPRKRLAFAG